MSGDALAFAKVLRLMLKFYFLLESDKALIMLGGKKESSLNGVCQRLMLRMLSLTALLQKTNATDYCTVRHDFP